MSKLTNALEKIGSNAKLKTESLNKVSSKLRKLGISHTLTNALIQKDSKNMKRLTNARSNMCCFIIRPPTALDVFSKPLNLIIKNNENKPLYCRKSIA